MPRDSADPDTEKIEKVAGRIASSLIDRRDALPRDCSEVHRINRLEKDLESAVTRIKLVEIGMSDGRVAFSEIRASQTVMQKSLDNINGTLSKLNWIVLTAVLVAIISLVVKATH